MFLKALSLLAMFRFIFIILIFVFQVPVFGDSGCGTDLLPKIVREAEDAGLRRLIHKTPITSRPYILRSKALVPGTSAVEKPSSQGIGFTTYRYDRIFLSLSTKSSDSKSLFATFCGSYSFMNGKESGDLNYAVLVFKSELLGVQNDFYAAPGMKYGQLAAYDHTNIVGFIKIQSESFDSNEIIFMHHIPLQGNLKEIWVHPSKLEGTHAVLKEAGISLENYPEIKIVPMEQFPNN